MQRLCYRVYSLLCYLVFVLASLWGIAFSGGFTPQTQWAGGRAFVPALLLDVALLSLFGLQHSVMARAGFKRWWTRIVPRPIERSTYVLLASLTLLLVFGQWRPLPGVVWAVEHPAGQALLWSVFGLGWLLVVVSTFVFDHFALTGLRQAWSDGRRRPSPPTPFRTPALYRLVRHPMMLGFLLAFWAPPRMSSGQLLFAVGMSAYVLIGLRYEERDLVRDFGARYRRYQQRVPMLIPWFQRRGAGGSDPHSHGDPAAQS